MSPARRFIGSRLTPFKVVEYRILFVAQLLSWVGTWMQDMGKSWLVLSQFGRGKEMGVIMLASAIPVAIFSIYAGPFADRSNPRRILLVTQTFLFATALLLAGLAYCGILQFWQMVAIAAIEGACVSFDAPAFQVLLPRLVGKENLQQTLALNSSLFHLSRIIGPALGGMLLIAFSISSIFLLNAVSFLVVCFAVYSFKNVDVSPGARPDQSSFRDFIKFLWSNPFFARILVQFVLVMMFIFPHTFTTLRLLVTERFHLDGKGFGILLTGPGMGAFLGSTLLVLIKPKKPYQLFPWGLTGIIIFGSLILYCYDFWMMNILLMLYTLSLFLYLSSLLVCLQIMIDHSLRGRVSALATLIFGAWAPAWSAVWGWASDHFGSANVFGVTGIVFLFVSFAVIAFWDRFFTPHVLEQPAK